MTATVTQDKNATARRRVPDEAAAALELDWDRLDAVVLFTLEDKALHRRLRNLEKLELGEIRAATYKTLSRYRLSGGDVVAPLELHRRLLEGLSGESLLVSSSMFLDTLQEVERFFDISFKTIKSKLGRTLDTGASELAMRAARAAIAAAEVLGGFEAAHKYLRTRNFALGGATPLELLKTAEGERLVMNELQAQADSGPI
jgi:hypothetical protein